MKFAQTGSPDFIPTDEDSVSLHGAIEKDPIAISRTLVRMVCNLIVTWNYQQLLHRYEHLHYAASIFQKSQKL